MTPPLLAYQERSPGARLASSVRCYWSLAVRAPLPPGFLHHVWPDGSFTLVVMSVRGELVAASVVGPGDEAHRIPLMEGASYRGVRFWPDTGGKLLRLPPREMRNRVLPWATALGNDTMDIARTIAAAPSVAAADASYEAWLGSLANEAESRDVIVQAAVDQLIATGGTRLIGDLTSDARVGLRQLQRRFLDRVGLSPKEFARICRGRAALELALSVNDNWSHVAATLGYADQPHLVRDLARLMGLKPRELRERLAVIEHQFLRT